MGTLLSRNNAKSISIQRTPKTFQQAIDEVGLPKKVSDYYGEEVFDIRTTNLISDKVREDLLNISKSHLPLPKELASTVAKAVLDWAMKKGATHFCHWFQPLTGGTAEKHDAFLQFDDKGFPIEKLSASEIMQGEPDASSFPNGGSRSTFEARGYTSWDLTSPMFLVKGVNSKTLCIPTAFVSYTGDALDIKTPLLRSVSTLSKEATKFLKLLGQTETQSVHVTCGCEQEYFLVDKSFYYSRPDLVMTGRTLFGSMTAKNQQLEDHYFGLIPERVIAFMEELDSELYSLGVPAKTRHNEVAPGQFEIAPIFKDSNIAADNNQLLMSTIKKVSERHNLMALLHEKPFAGINGSGKHVNWSMGDDLGNNLLSPGPNPHGNLSFLATVSIVMEAVKRHASVIRASISSAGNDHRLGANEAPPSILSVFLGDTLDKIFQSILNGEELGSCKTESLDLGASQLADLLKDNTDRNRTSPFAFTGNKFEFRAVGSSHAVGFPVSILNAAVADVYKDSNAFLEAELEKGTEIKQALLSLTKKWLRSSYDIVFNGDGYSQEWANEAEKRGLPNLRTTADCLDVFVNEEKTDFLTSQNIYSNNELKTRYNVLLERYITLRNIEFVTMNGLVKKNILPSAFEYKKELGIVIKNQKDLGLASNVEMEIYKRLNFSIESLFASLSSMNNSLNEIATKSHLDQAKDIAHEIMPLSESVAKFCDEIEELIPSNLWSLPTYFDMLFIK